MLDFGFDEIYLDDDKKVRKSAQRLRKLLIKNNIIGSFDEVNACYYYPNDGGRKVAYIIYEYPFTQANCIIRIWFTKNYEFRIYCNRDKMLYTAGKFKAFDKLGDDAFIKKMKFNRDYMIWENFHN